MRFFSFSSPKYLEIIYGTWVKFLIYTGDHSGYSIESSASTTLISTDEHLMNLMNIKSLKNTKIGTLS